MTIHELRPGFAGPPPALDELISEDQVLKWRPALAKSLLLAARKEHKITYTVGKRRSAWYTLRNVDAFLKTRESQCKGAASCLNSPDTTLPPSPAAPDSIATGETGALLELAGEALALRILQKQKSG